MNNLFDNTMSQNHSLPNTRPPVSQETRNKIGKALTGVPKSLEHRKSISKGMLMNTNTCKPICFQGVEYKSMKECLQVNQLTYKLISMMIKSPDYPLVYVL